MNPELLTAVQDCRARGLTEDEIIAQLQVAGYEAQQISQTLELVDQAPSAPEAVGEMSAPAASPLPSVRTLWRSGWHFVLQRWDLVALLAIPFGLVELLVFGAQGSYLNQGTTFELLAGVAGLVAVAVYFVVFAAALHTAQQYPKPSRLTASLRWAREHLWALGWLVLLSSLVVFGGLVLLIIPAIIIGVSISLAQMVFVHEGTTGLRALARSRSLVQGRWWAVAWRFGLVWLLFFSLIVVSGTVLGGMASLAGASESVTTLVINILFTAFNAVGVLLFLVVAKQLYGVLAVDRPVQQTMVSAGRGRYLALAWLGLVSLLLLLLAGSLTESNTFGQVDTLALQQFTTELARAQEQADLYFVGPGEASYLGVCELIRDNFTTATNIECNNGLTDYALAGQVAGQTWCIDATGYRKIIYTALASRTRCLAVTPGN